MENRGLLYTQKMLTNYHTHCDFCDGKTSARIMAQAARATGYTTLGFSSHAPLPFKTEWNMDIERLPEYIETIRSLAREHAPEMEILVGLELDYIEGLCGPRDGRFSAAGLDYTMASVHYVTPAGAPKPSEAIPEPGYEPTFGFTVDEPEDDFGSHLGSFYAGDAEAMVDDYYRLLTSCIGEGGFDILGHFDLIRKNNAGQRYFREDTERYRNAVMKAVDAIAGSDILVEINTGGMARGKTDAPYPAPWILKELSSRGVAVCINADAHRPEHLSANRQDGVRAAIEAGYKNLVAIGRTGRHEIPIN
jgi:histidinol-phosphatase (PHP family)